MKVGIAYAHAWEKRAFDIAVASPLVPAAFAGQTLLKHLAKRRSPEDDAAQFRQERVGKDGAIIVVHKLRTLDSSTKQPLSPLAELFRCYGIDELRQVDNILRNEMSIVGRRPIIPEEHEAIMEQAPKKLRERWKRIVLPTKPGLISTFSILNHQESTKIVQKGPFKLECDIHDVLNGSLTYDAAMIGRAVLAAARGET